MYRTKTGRHWPILMVKVEVKAMHIYTINILEMVTDWVRITNAIKYQVRYGLSIGIFIFQFDQF